MVRRKKIKRKRRTKGDKRHSEGTVRGRLNHAGESIGNFVADTMAKCIAEINFWENKAKAEGKDKPDKEHARQ